MSDLVMRRLLAGYTVVLLALGAVQAAAQGITPVDTGLPVLRVTTTGAQAITSKDTYLAGTLKITDGSKTVYGAGLYDGNVQIRGRGNSTWLMPKKPYRLRLPAAAPMLDMPADRDWVLLANYTDKSLLRTDLAFELSRRLGLAWTPRMRHVELFVNDEYLGSYLLGEHVKVAANRANVVPMSASDNVAPALTGGYFIEADQLVNLDPGDFYVLRGSGILFNIKEPSASSISADQKAYITNYLQEVERALMRDDFADPALGYAAYIDVDTFVGWYLTNELVKNVDAPFVSSVYLYKDRNQKLKMGPAWDFDLAAGNVDFSEARDPRGWRIRDQSLWFNRLFQDPAFAKKVRDRWNSIKRSQIDTLPAYVDQLAATLTISHQENFRRWSLTQYDWPNAVVAGSYAGELRYLKNWLAQRIAWMDRRLNEMDATQRR
jgi:CotH kinase protein